DIRSGRFTRPATKTPAPAAPAPAPLEPAPVPDAPILIARQSGPATPNALDALKHDTAGGTDDVGAMTASLQSPDAPPTTRDAAPGAEVFLQFGAFSAAQTAVSLAGKLNQQIGPFEPRQAYVQEGDGLHRVRIGPYPSRTAAVNASVRIQQETGLQSSMALRSRLPGQGARIQHLAGQARHLRASPGGLPPGNRSQQRLHQPHG